MSQHKLAAVIGGANMDIHGQPFLRLSPMDSCPGTVQYNMGGVGRNIAHNLRLLEVPTRLVTVWGDDASGHSLEQQCRALGMDLSLSECIQSARTSTYLFISDEKGEMQLAIADMQITDYITPEFLDTRMAELNRADVCVIDTNVTAETLEYFCRHCRVPIFCDPISTAKAEKLKGVLPYLHTLKPNLQEAEVLTGIAITDDASLRAAADALRAAGVRRVFISLGAHGAYCLSEEGECRLPIFPTRVRNATGCGDCFTASLVWSYLHGCSAEDSLRLALAAGSVAAEGPDTINPLLCADAVFRRAGIRPF